MPNIFTIPPHLLFLETLASGILQEYGHDPLVFSNITILLPNRRACKNLQQAFLRANNGVPLLLPQIMPIGEGSDDEFIFKLRGAGCRKGYSPIPNIHENGEEVYTPSRNLNANFEIPNLISPIAQRLLLTQLIEKWQSATNEKITTPQAAHLAIELAAFLGEVEKEQLSFDDIAKIVPDDLSNHWQVTLNFLRILIEEWPNILLEENAVDIHTHRNLVLNLQAEHWQNNQPEYPVIAAGSTGSIPATANLLKTIAFMPNGRVILPGLDQQLDDASWEIIEETHPQFGLKQLLGVMGVERSGVRNLESGIRNLESKTQVVSKKGYIPLLNVHENGEGVYTPSGYKVVESPATSHQPLATKLATCNSQLATELMRPAATTSLWKNLRDSRFEIRDSIQLITAPTLQEEATIIALIMKETLQTPGKTAALVTNQRDLARYVSATLQRWDVAIDDSAGNDLSNTPQAVFLRLLAQMAMDKAANPISLLNFLKHPFATCGMHPAEFRNNVRKLELATLRGIRPNNGISDFYKLIDDTELKTWLQTIEKTIAPLLNLLAQKAVPFAQILQVHIEVAENFATADSIWQNAAGEQLKDFLDELILPAKRFKSIDPFDYAGLLDALLTGQTYRPAYGTHPRLSILSPIEARMLSFDLVIMGELNEGSWPATGKSDPWMSRPMRSNFGLPLPEKKIGQSAQDFAQLFCSPNVIMTRCEKHGGSQTIPSRWLLRLDAILKILGAEDAIKPKKPWAEWAELLNKPENIQACLPPEPRPAAHLRPSRLAVTGIEKLMRDPYSIYASKILELKKLDPIDKEPGPAEFGNFIHKALEMFVKGYELQVASCKLQVEQNDGREGYIPLPHVHENWEGVNTPSGNEVENLDSRFLILDSLLTCGHRILTDQNLKPSIHAFWWPRFERIAEWFVDNEIKRREGGAKIFSEIKGEYKIGDFTLEARADRIEIDNDGKISIIDYKTGSVPNAKDIELGFSPQMVLEGLITGNGGFEIESGIKNQESSENSTVARVGGCTPDPTFMQNSEPTNNDEQNGMNMRKGVQPPSGNEDGRKGFKPLPNVHENGEGVNTPSRYSATTPHSLSHWKLSGSATAVEESPINPEKIQNLIKEAEKGLNLLINLFSNDSTPYLPCPNPEKAPAYNDYEHLERVKEWID